MRKEKFVGRLLLKRFFKELSTKLLDDVKDSRTLIKFKKQKDRDIDQSFPHILVFHGDNGSGKTSALTFCTDIAKDVSEELKKNLNIVTIDWENWYYNKWTLPGTNIELLKAFYEMLSIKSNGLSSYFSRFESLYSKIKKISDRVDILVRNEWIRESFDLSETDVPEQDRLKNWLQKKIPKQDLDILEKADNKLAEILVTGLSEASSESPIILTIDNYEYLPDGTEKWFRTEFLNRLTELRLVTIIAGSGFFTKRFRNTFPEESLHIVNFNDNTLSKLDIIQLAINSHITINELDAENIEQYTSGMPLAVQDLFSYVLKGTVLHELLSPIDNCSILTTEQLIDGIAGRFLKYCTDLKTRERVLHLVMLKQYNVTLLSQLWMVSEKEVSSIISTLSEQFAFIGTGTINPFVKNALTTYLHQQLSVNDDPALMTFYDHFTTVCSQYFTNLRIQLESTISPAEIRYSDERYCNALIGYINSLLWSSPDTAFNSLSGIYLELIHFNVNFVTQLFWHIGEFRNALPQYCTDSLDILYNGIIIADQTLLSNRVPVDAAEIAVMDYLEQKLGEMNNFQKALFYHKKGELSLRQNKIQAAKELLDTALSLMETETPERELLYEDFILLSNEFSSKGELENVVQSLNNAVSINSGNYLPWFDLGMAYLRMDDHTHAEEALSKSVSINPDYQDTWFYLGLSYSATENHERAVEAFVKAIEKGPENIDICYNMGISLERTEKNSDAVKMFQKVVALDPKHVDAWHRMGSLYSGLGQSEEAINAFLNAITIKPDLIDAYNSLGFEYSKTGKFKDAAEAFEKAAEINADDAELWNRIAQSWFSADQNQKAIDTAAKSIALVQDSSEPWLITGNAHTALGNFKEANSAYTKASEISPEDASIWVNLGNNFYAQSMYEEAIAAFKKAVTINPQQEGTWFNLGLAYRVKEQFDEALDAFEHAIKQEADNSECWFQKGRTHMTLNQFEKAAESFSKTVELSPTSHDAWYKRGLAFAKCGNHNEAIASFIKASQLWATDPDIWLNMGLSYCAIDNHNDAVKSFQKASELASSRQEIWYNLGFSFQMLGHYQDAIEAYNRSLQIVADHFLSSYNKGICLYYLGNYADAQIELNTAVSLQPEHTDALSFLALTWHALGNYQEAINYYQKITELKEDSSEAWFNMALAYHSQANYDKAIEVYCHIVNKWPENSSAWYNMGMVFHARDQLDEAIQAYRQASTLNANQSEIWYSLGTAFHAQEQYGEAIQAYRKVVKITPDHIDAHINLGLAYSMWGHHADAAESYSKVVKIKPDHLIAWENLCVAQYSINQFEQAIESAQKVLEIKSDELWVISYLILASLLSGKVAKAQEFTDKLISANNNGDIITRTIDFLNQEVSKKTDIQGAQEILQKLEGAQMEAFSVSLPETNLS